MTQPHKGTILVVDDEAAIREIEGRILTSAGYQVVQSDGAAEAFKALADGLSPDLVIADLDMPAIPGEAMVRSIHQARPHQRVLYVTANINRLLDVQSIVWEGEAFLEKPFTTKSLLEAVSLLLRGTIADAPVAAALAARGGIIENLRRTFKFWGRHD